MSCSTEALANKAERRRVEALMAAVEVAGWQRSVSEPEEIIDIAREFVGFLRGDDEDAHDE
ncbi:hypothetical protein FHS82_001036 [Pseudochelatococcus lubricantis]|uniref:Uncharacterized protein n=1 Tax=Pseudochelatococcus lubricantis TaxID=1538102 RepID=A0ABX0UZ98_9HYPH|nr:hypothetical protein [Pseudochelatococcus lubricantis]NIJ57210.1 hypothetical protein [Pseudochelatococcus lubricantis]